MIRVGINGFGRIGRRVFRLLLEQNDIQVVAVNDLADKKTLAHLLKYDSIHGKIDASFRDNETHLIVNDRSIACAHQNHPKSIDWAKYKVDVVVEATGKFKNKTNLQHHINNGAQKVILSVPPIGK